MTRLETLRDNRQSGLGAVESNKLRGGVSPSAGAGFLKESERT